jgi:sulfite exporter TauE/SafE
VIDALVVGAAVVTGLLGSPHCALMCGGIASGFGARAARPSLIHALQPNLGRIAGYVLAGALAGSLGQGIVAILGSDVLRIALRTLAGIALLLVALRLLGRTRLSFDAPARTLLAPLASLRARVGPADTAARRIAAGLVWGWLPCGLSTSLLTVAWLRADALEGALTMLAFGLGGLPAMLSLTWTGARLGQALQRGGLRIAAASLVAFGGAATLAAPWLVHAPRVHALLASLGCASVLRP